MNEEKQKPLPKPKRIARKKRAVARIFRKENVLPALICLGAAILFWLYVQNL